MSTSSKRKRVVLSLEEEKEILQVLERGVSGRSISEKYGISTATVSDIKRKGRTILDYSEKWTQEGGCSNRRIMKTPKLEGVDEALYAWFVQKRAAGIPMTGSLLCEKALEFNWRLGADPDFKASQGAKAKFKRRHGIHGREICGEKLSGDQLSADAFRVVLHTFMEEGGYDEEFVYNADEAGLNWKSLPTRSLVAHQRTMTSGHKARKERVTVMICANSMGSHLHTVFVIGKPANPRSFRNVKKLPVVYSHQKKAPWNEEYLAAQ
ncbi:hypothetical protein M513_08474 [Trichuris suis]|uniref:HTH CENPB-type domain-containing protein n=1 Tax=Trichuris suis TaxID=68888 RepID=A0A085M0C1_9BILA|nr:hypothetical protein M513_08474 [Trichuris suis]